MHQLVAQRVQAHEHLVQHPLRILLRQRALNALARIVERLALMLRKAAIAAWVVERIQQTYPLQSIRRDLPSQEIGSITSDMSLGEALQRFLMHRSGCLQMACRLGRAQSPSSLSSF